MAVQFAAGQRHAHAVAPGDTRGVADDRGAVGVPADSIAPAEHGKRTERLETRGSGAKAAIGAVAALRRGAGQPAVGSHQPGTDAAKTPAEIEGFERARERLIAALPRGHLSAYRRGPRVERPNTRLASVQPRRHGRLDTVGEPIDVIEEVVLARDHHFCGG